MVSVKQTELLVGQVPDMSSSPSRTGLVFMIPLQGTLQVISRLMQRHTNSYSCYNYANHCIVGATEIRVTSTNCDSRGS